MAEVEFDRVLTWYNLNSVVNNFTIFPGIFASTVGLRRQHHLALNTTTCNPSPIDPVNMRYMVFALELGLCKHMTSAR